MSTVRPVSRHHVLAVTPRLAELPSHLVKTLMCLAAHANHKTGTSRPGETVMADWGIPYSTWHRHCVELTALGLVKQVVRGNSILNLAAEYQLLFVAPLTDGLPTTTQGEGDYITTKSKSNPQGGAPAREKAPWPELTPYELAAWEDFTARLRPRLDSSDLAMLNEQIHGFDQVIPLQRTVVRLVQHGHGPSLLNALAERGNPDLPVYGGARNLPATLFKRLQRFADQHQVRVWDRSAVVAEEASPYKQAWDALGLRVGGADSPPQEQRHP